MPRGIEGEGPRGEPTSQQPSQPEQTQPLQGRAAGRESLQGPTILDSSEQSNPQPESELKRRIAEMRASYENRDLEELRNLSEKDPTLFATRAMGALEELLKARVPHAESKRERGVEKSRAYFKSAGYTCETLLPHGRLLQNARQNGQNAGYVEGLEAAFGFLHDRITGTNEWPPLPLAEEPQGQSQEGNDNPKT